MHKALMLYEVMWSKGANEFNHIPMNTIWFEYYYADIRVIFSKIYFNDIQSLQPGQFSSLKMIRSFHISKMLNY